MILAIEKGRENAIEDFKRGAPGILNHRGIIQ